MTQADVEQVANEFSPARDDLSDMFDDQVGECFGHTANGGPAILQPARSGTDRHVLPLAAKHIENRRLALRSTIDPNAQTAPVAAHATSAPSDTTGTTATH